MGYNQARLRRLNDRKTNPGGDYVLYWAQIYRRLDHNHALDYALRGRALLGPAVAAAAHLRPRIHKAFAEAWSHRAGAPRRLERKSYGWARRSSAASQPSRTAAWLARRE